MILSNAINEAEAAIRPTMPDTAPVAVTNACLMELVAAAKGGLDVDRLAELQDTVNSVVKILKQAVE